MVKNVQKCGNGIENTQTHPELDKKLLKNSTKTPSKPTQNAPNLSKTYKKCEKALKPVISHPSCSKTYKNGEKRQKPNRAPQNGQKCTKMWKLRRKTTQTPPKLDNFFRKKLNITRPNPPRTPQSCPKTRKNVKKS